MNLCITNRILVANIREVRKLHEIPEWLYYSECGLNIRNLFSTLVETQKSKFQALLSGLCVASLYLCLAERSQQKQGLCPPSKQFYIKSLCVCAKAKQEQEKERTCPSQPEG